MIIIKNKSHFLKQIDKAMRKVKKKIHKEQKKNPVTVCQLTQTFVCVQKVDIHGRAGTEKFDVFMILCIFTVGFVY